MSQLPGMGGVYNSLNLGLYTYSHFNPIRLLDPDGNATGMTVTLDGNKYFLVAQTRAEICGGSRTCQQTVAAGLAAAHLDMHEISNNGETMYLSKSFGDNAIYLSKEQELAFGAMSDVTGTAALVPTPASPGLAAASALLKGGEVAVSDDKAKTVVEAGADYAGGKYTRALGREVLVKPPGGKPTLGGNVTEAAGGKVFGGAAASAMDQRAGSAKNQLKASEAQRQLKQQQDLKLLNGE